MTTRDRVLAAVGAAVVVAGGALAYAGDAQHRALLSDEGRSMAIRNGYTMATARTTFGLGAAGVALGVGVGVLGLSGARRQRSDDATDRACRMAAAGTR